jgi:hypothetical protein
MQMSGFRRPTTVELLVGLVIVALLAASRSPVFAPPPVLSQAECELVEAALVE